MFIVIFYTESGDHYVEGFNKFPTDKHLSAYVLEKFPDEIRRKDEEDDESEPVSRTIFWTIHEIEVKELPKPLKRAIPSI